MLADGTHIQSELIRDKCTGKVSRQCSADHYCSSVELTVGAANNPIYYIDPNGRDFIIDDVAWGAAAAFAAAATLAVVAKNAWQDAKDEIRELCRRAKKKVYACAAACQKNGAVSGADYAVGWSSVNCAEATKSAKASVPFGEYPRHCACIDTDGFQGKGTQCENHTR